MDRSRKKWADNNLGWVKSYQSEYRANNVEKLRGLARDWRRRNSDYVRAQRAAKGLRHRRPKWADLFKMAEFYGLAKRLTEETGVQHDVDHIVPLRNPFVCGLHCEHNLRVIPAVQNQRKSNFYWPDQPWGIPWEMAGIE